MRTQALNLCFLICIFPVSTKASCLNEVANFAERICGEIDRSGLRTTIDSKGNLDASVGKIVKKVIGGGSVDVSGKALVESYSNVLQGELGSELFNVRDCRTKMVAVAMREICAGNTEFKPDYKTSGLVLYKVCSGSLQSECPPHDVHLFCNRDIAIWARGKCSSFSINLVESSRGGQCGYRIHDVSCRPLQ